MREVNMMQLAQLIEAVTLDPQHGDPVFIWGLMGVGKSELIAQLCAKHEGVLVDVRLSQYDSVDLRGFPGVEPGTDQTVWYAPSTLPFKGNPRFDEDSGKPIFLFFDEANSATDAVSAVTYQITNDRRCGEHMLMDNVVIILAGNTENSRGVTNRQPAPLSNRLIHVLLVATIEHWSRWAVRNGQPNELIGFLNWRDLLHTYDPKDPTQKAFGTPRTWAKVGRFHNDTRMLEDVRETASMGAVGEANYLEFQGFLNIWRSLTPIADILAKPDTVPVPTKLDELYAMAMHVSGHMKPDNVATLHRYLQRFDPEYVVLAWMMACDRDDLIVNTDTFLREYAPKYRQFAA